ncbi:hypothetical protein AAE02nite_31290 [Adhaeribacter aerolatus]|uniref:Metal-sensitive transcriptional regulator n=1 Tax=Adhaeribacter aerolatus TaxID=670289 RepID=A0A512B0H9_9BACT|nr:metal-sensing transcriptional repressor [Adhaeribacter aerolatus]GEO05465.1 hypothetical protein AAE02nite_31290 [Adhaeribacter aerolatus]
MLQKDLIRDVKTRLNTIKGQIEGIIKMLDNDRDPEQIRQQFKATGKALENAELLLLDETFRKSLAVKIAETIQSCPGNCGQEEIIERLRRQFPDLGDDELTDKMKEIQFVSDQVKKNQEQQ